jgi:hypothetical protein
MVHTVDQCFTERVHIPTHIFDRYEHVIFNLNVISIMFNISPRNYRKDERSAPLLYYMERDIMEGVAKLAWPNTNLPSRRCKMNLS